MNLAIHLAVWVGLTAVALSLVFVRGDDRDTPIRSHCAAIAIITASGCAVIAVILVGVRLVVTA